VKMAQNGLNILNMVNRRYTITLSRIGSCFSSYFVNHFSNFSYRYQMISKSLQCHLTILSRSFHVRSYTTTLLSFYDHLHDHVTIFHNHLHDHFTIIYAITSSFHNRLQSNHKRLPARSPKSILLFSLVIN
jgi:hypothetical protein